MEEPEVVADGSSRKRKRSRKEKSSRREHNDSKLKRQRIYEASGVIDPYSKKARSKSESYDSNSIMSEVGKLEEPRELVKEIEARKMNQKRTRAKGGNGKELQLMDGAATEHISDQSMILPEESRRGKWFVSGPVGGRLLHLDPQFTSDEE